MAIYARDARILVVDDNKVNQMLAKGALSAYEPQIDVAGSGQEAILLVKTYSYDMIFMDLLMPEMDGIETIARLIGEGITLPPIVALTGKTDENLRDLKSHGFVDFIKKPAKPEDIERVLTQYIKKELITEK